VGVRERAAEVPLYARVAIARPLKPLYTYSFPALFGPPRLGQVVLVPLGARGADTGYVVEVLDKPDISPDRVKPISRILDPDPAFDDRQLRFFRWIADYYLAPLGLVIQTALPSGFRARVVSVLEPADAGIEALALHKAEGAVATVLREVVARPGLTRKAVVRRLDGEVDPGEAERAVESMLRKGWLALGEREVHETRGRVAIVSLVGTRDEARAKVPRLGPRMAAVIEALAYADGTVDLRALVDAQGSGVRDALDRLEAAGVISRGEREDRDVLSAAPARGPVHPPVLNADQSAALAALEAAEGTFLLWGVTGSGKTEVFLGAARRTLDAGRQVLVLVPEIGLTPQLVGRFRARFGDDVAVLHSGLTGAQRLAQWRRIRAGEARVAVGARSALFAPFRDLGLIVVDEEHDDSYKQDDGVAYGARDLAVVLGREHRAAVVLASATPSLETWVNARAGRYRLLRLPHRATPRPVPVIETVDMTQVERVEGKVPTLAPSVVDALRQTFDAGGKAIVLYNRRGFATLVQCTSCGGAYECPSCGIAMTLHRQANVVACHYCGFKRSYTVTCPACGKPDLDELGRGTERIEEVLSAFFPDVPIGRMDADTTQVRGAHEQILDAFGSGKTRLLVGTQIVAKGHDFPDVHTAVVVSADQGLRMPDFRAAERTYALIVQLAGRAGRGDVPGRVLLQTFQPDHDVLRMLADPDVFYEREVELRRLMRYPPLTRLALIRLDAEDRKEVAEAARRLARALRELRGSEAEGNEVLGPAPAALARLVGRWRFQILLRGRQPAAYRRWLSACEPVLWEARGGKVRVSWDVDPRTLM
jgi:primosomal protein N' (replication factor Y)